MSIRLAPAVAAAIALAGVVGIPATAATAAAPAPTETAAPVEKKAPAKEAPAVEAPKEAAPEEPAEEAPAPAAPEEPAPEEPAPEETPAEETPSEEPTPEETKAPEATVSAEAADEALDAGEDAELTVSFTGAKADSELSVTIDGQESAASTTVADADGALTVTIKADELSEGENTVEVGVVNADEVEATDQLTVTVAKAAATEEPTPTESAAPTEGPAATEDPSEAPASETPEAAAADPALDVLTGEVALRDFVRTPGEDDGGGAQYVLTGLNPGGDYIISVTTPDGEEIDVETVTADENGAYPGVIFYLGDKDDETNADDLLGDYTITAYSAEGDEVAGGDFTVVGNDDDDAPSEGADEVVALSVSPKRLSSTDFVDRSKGVLLEATGFEPGETVTANISPRGTGITPYTMTRTADKNGDVQFGVYGTNDSNPEVYVDTYDVWVNGDDDSDAGAGGKFTVYSNGHSGGGGSYLPRTGGSDLAGLAVGAGLLVLGTGSIVLTRRRTKSKDLGEA